MGIIHLLEETNSSILKANVDPEREVMFDHSITFPIDAYLVIESQHTGKRAVIALIELTAGGKKINDGSLIKSTVVSGDGIECHIRLLNPDEAGFANQYLGPYDLSKPVDIEIMKQLLEKH